MKIYSRRFSWRKQWWTQRSGQWQKKRPFQTILAQKMSKGFKSTRCGKKVLLGDLSRTSSPQKYYKAMTDKPWSRTSAL
jgi:hypothetical protein